MRTEIRRVNLPDFVIRECSYSPGLRMPRHSHELTSVTIVISGQIEEEAERGRHCGRASSVALKPAHSEHENRVSGFGARTLTLELNRGSAMSRRLGSSRWSWFEQPGIVRAAIALRRAMTALDDPSSSAHEFLESVCAAAVNETAHLPAPQWLPDVLRILDEHFESSLRFDAIARDLGLHPVYLSRAFRRHTGVTMHDYVRALRLRSARHLLSVSKRSVAAIAAQCGFSDSSHLCRTFSECLDMTPKSYRRLFNACADDRASGGVSSQHRA